MDIGGKWQKEKVEASHFFTNRDIDKLIHETENTVTSDLEEGDRQKGEDLFIEVLKLKIFNGFCFLFTAMKRLRVPPIGNISCSIKSIAIN